MKFSSFRICILVFLLFSGLVKVAVSQSNDEGGRNFITWNDLKVEGHSLKSEAKDLANSKQIVRLIVVDKNGTGDSVTVQGAVDMVPVNNVDRVKIHILPGIYREKVHIPMNKPYISFIGDEGDASRTVITWNDKASDKTPSGGWLGTWNSASVTVLSDYFCATGITFMNTIIAEVGGVNGYQAVALRIAGEKAMFYKARFLGSQDTLLDETGTHYFFQCFIQGSTDFVFGNAKSLYQECAISVVGYGFAVAAQHRNMVDEDTGFSFVNCTVSGTGTIYLGRAWGNYSRILYINSEFDIDVRPKGWDDWRLPSRQNTVVFGEHNCRGRGANRTGRVPWAKALDYKEAEPFLDTRFIRGGEWLKL